MATLQEKRFAEIAVKKGLADPEKVNAALTAVDEAVAKGQRATLLDTMLERGWIQEPQKQEILKAAEADGPLVLGDFEIIELLGQGGMGAVYKAREISLDRLCALKLLPAHLAREPSIVARFRREAQACAKLDHPHIIRGYRVGEVDGQHYFAMELVEGTSVDRIIEEKGPMEIDEAVKILKQIASALDYAHRAKMIHRDIKPDNIMITKDGVAKLADLGLVKAGDTEQTRVTMSGTGMGTPAYMPPEQAKGAKHADERSDLYSLGATLYHMVTGEMPYKGDSAFEVMQQHEKGVLKPPRSLRPEVPSWLDLIIGKLMARKPENRFQSAKELLEAVERHTGGRAATTAPPTPRAAPRRPVDRFWHLRIPQKDGSLKKAKAETAALRQLLSEGKLPLTTLARRGQQGDFKPVNEYPQLIASVTATKSHKDKRGAGVLTAFYRDVEVAARRRRRARKIKRLVGRAVVVLVLVGLAIAGYRYHAEILAWVKGLLGK